jgi:Ni/Co efflux regulator RcnB
MRFARLLLTSCAALCLAGPALAQPPAGKDDQHPQKQGGQRGAPAGHPGQGGPGAGAQRPARSAPQAQPQAQAQNRSQVQARPQAQPQAAQPQARPQAAARAPFPASPSPAGPSPRRAQSAPQAGAGSPQRRGPAGAPPARQQAQSAGPARGAAARPSLGAWNTGVAGPQRTQLGQQWRQQNQSWDRGAIWRGNSGWYRGDPAFSLFNGIRAGFFFFPDYGYLAPPRAYIGRHWQAGDILPAWFLSHRVKHASHYGLPRAPQGCAWVWVDDGVALVDLRDGYVLDVTYNLW